MSFCDVRLYRAMYTIKRSTIDKCSAPFDGNVHLFPHGQTINALYTY